MADKSEGRVSQAADAAREKINTYKQKAGEGMARGSEYAREKVKIVDDRVHNNPWPVIGSVFVSGILLGYILGRQSD